MLQSFTRVSKPGLLILVGFMAVIVFFGPTDNWSWDPSFYYAQMRSPIIENDLDFRSEIATRDAELTPTVTGLIHSSWPIGPSILWSPFFLISHAVVLLTNPAQADGFLFPYIGLVSLGSLLYDFAGLLMIYRACRYFASRAGSLVTTSLCLGATPLFYYMFRQPIMAHTTGLFASTTIVLVYLVLSEQADLSKESGLLFGISLGLCFLTRWNGLLLGVAPLVYFADHLYRAALLRSVRDIKRVLLQVVIMSAVFVLTISPQLALWYRMHLRFLVNPQPGSYHYVGGMIPVNLMNIFVHTNRGLIHWSPFVLIGIIGIVFIPRTQVKLMAIAVLTSLLILIGYRVDWYSGGGYGARYFIEILPFVAIGFVSLLQRAPDGIGWRVLIAIGITALFVHQFVLIFAVEHATDGWINFGDYLNGRPIGVRWQWNTFANLVRDPAL